MGAGDRLPPWQLRAFVLINLLSLAFPFVVRDSRVNWWTVFFAVIALALLKKLWDGEAVVWYFLTIATGVGLATATLRLIEGPIAAWGVALGAASFVLLVVEPSRVWCGVSARSDRQDASGPAEPPA